MLKISVKMRKQKDHNGHNKWVLLYNKESKN